MTDSATFSRVVAGLLAESMQGRRVPPPPDDGSEGTPPDEAGPASPPEAEMAPQSTHAEALILRSDSDWQRLHARFTSGRGGNLKPWFRCISLLRSLGAVSVVIEDYYVCLDYKSEYAAFYSYLDAPRPSWTSRLHFFSQSVDLTDVTDLQPAQQASYLGYIVCRKGDLPLVGRCLLKVPTAYIQESTAVVEKVNFFAQPLTVEGVPFMQQDERFAVCAHVALWVAHYTAYRRGTTERRLIADVVTLTGSLQPLRPHVADGLTTHQVSAMLGELGFRATLWNSPNQYTNFNDLPKVRPQDLPSKLATDLAGLLGVSPGAFARYPDVSAEIASRFGLQMAMAAARGAEKELRAGNAAVAQTSPSDSPERAPAQTGEPISNVGVALHKILDYLVAPYIRSGWPVYAASRDHAVVLCGRSVIDDNPVYFVHDDQNGPYLAAEWLPLLSRQSFAYQSGMVNSRDPRRRLTCPPTDRVLTSLPTLTDLRRPDTELGISSLVIAAPPRVLLSASAAERQARRTLAAVRRPLSSVRLEGSSVQLLNGEHSSIVSVLMGIDYKAARRQQALQRRDEAATLAFSAVQLAEWVVVVEGVNDEGLVVWEFVYDASSSDQSPRLQLGRVLKTITTMWPVGDGPAESTIEAQPFGNRLGVPKSVGKVLLHPPSQLKAKEEAQG